MNYLEFGVFLLQAFIASDITFAMKPYFRGNFCTTGVREGLVVAFLKHVNSVCQVHTIIYQICRMIDVQHAPPPHPPAPHTF